MACFVILFFFIELENVANLRIGIVVIATNNFLAFIIYALALMAIVREV